MKIKDLMNNAWCGTHIGDNCPTDRTRTTQPTHGTQEQRVLRVIIPLPYAAKAEGMVTW